MILKTETFEQENNSHDLTHWHDKIEIIRVLKDSMRCVVNGENYILSKDDICIINRGQLHRICCNDANNMCVFQRLMIEPSLFTSDKNIYQKYIVPILTDETFSHVHIKNGNSFTMELLNIIDGIADIEKIQPVAFELKVIALLYMFFQRLYQYYIKLKDKTNSFAHSDILIYRRIVDYIYRNFSEKLTLENIAASGNVSRSKCCLIFKKYAGHSPIDFLNLYRLQISTNLLKNTHDSIASIAAYCGFGQQSYYNRLFLREYGITPREYRSLHNSGEA